MYIGIIFFNWVLMMFSAVNQRVDNLSSLTDDIVSILQKHNEMILGPVRMKRDHQQIIQTTKGTGICYTLCCACHLWLAGTRRRVFSQSASGPVVWPPAFQRTQAALFP